MEASKLIKLRAFYQFYYRIITLEYRRILPPVQHEKIYDRVSMLYVNNITHIYFWQYRLLIIQFSVYLYIYQLFINRYKNDKHEEKYGMFDIC